MCYICTFLPFTTHHRLLSSTSPPNFRILQAATKVTEVSKYKFKRTAGDRHLHFVVYCAYVLVRSPRSVTSPYICMYTKEPANKTDKILWRPSDPLRNMIPPTCGQPDPVHPLQFAQAADLIPVKSLLDRLQLFRISSICLTPSSKSCNLSTSGICPPTKSSIQFPHSNFVSSIPIHLPPFRPTSCRLTCFNCFPGSCHAYTITKTGNRHKALENHLFLTNNFRQPSTCLPPTYFCLCIEIPYYYTCSRPFCPTSFFLHILACVWSNRFSRQPDIFHHMPRVQPASLISSNSLSKPQSVETLSKRLPGKI